MRRSCSFAWCTFAITLIAMIHGASLELRAQEMLTEKMMVQNTDPHPLIDGEVLREMISDNTVTGRHDTGMPYSEWHAPDGRVFGHNNHVANEEACWDIRGDSVCYYYAGGPARGTFCWTFRKISENGFRLQSVESGLGAAGLLQKGNPYNFTDNGKPWKCEPLSSKNMTPRYALKRHAAK